MSKSSKVVDGGTSALATAPDVSAASAPLEEGGGGTALDDTPLGREGVTLK